VVVHAAASIRLVALALLLPGVSQRSAY
jgi:hypothetical protein